MATTEITPKGQQGVGERPPLLSENYSRRVLPPVMNTRAMTALFVLVLFFITNVPTAVAGGPSGLTLWLVGGVCFFIPCGIACAQLGGMFPNEGGIYNWTYQIMGGGWSFFVLLISWLPGPLLIVATGDLLVTYLQSLNQNWLVQPWQQALVLIAVIAVSGFLCTQRTATIQRIITTTAALIVTASGLVLLAALVWLVTKHTSTTNFSHLPDWNPFTAQNFPLFGVITLGYLGVNLPMNLLGEVKTGNERDTRNIITRHLFWGISLVLVLYLAVTAAVLVVQGPNGANNLFTLVSIVDITLGKTLGNVEAVLIMTTFLISTAVYNFIFSRYLMVAGFDQLLTSAPGRLNLNRSPARAVVFQTLVAIMLAVLLFLVMPYSGLYKGNPGDLATIDYFIGVGTGTLLWAFSTIFLFVNVFVLFVRRRKLLKERRLVPIPVLVVSSGIGFCTGIVAIIDTLFNSYIPPLIANGVWILFVGGFTVVLIIVAAILTILVSGESTWEVERYTGHPSDRYSR